MRLRALIAFLAFATLAAICIHRPAQNAGLPIVEGAVMSKTALKDYPKDHMLFAPCVGGQFAPRPKRNYAAISRNVSTNTGTLLAEASFEAADAEVPTT